MRKQLHTAGQTSRHNKAGGSHMALGTLKTSGCAEYLRSTGGSKIKAQILMDPGVTPASHWKWLSL